jgi:hypothetical protein
MEMVKTMLSQNHPGTQSAPTPPNTKLHSKVEYGCCAPPLDEEKMMGKVTGAAPHLWIDEVKGK